MANADFILLDDAVKLCNGFASMLEADDPKDNVDRIRNRAGVAAAKGLALAFGELRHWSFPVSLIGGDFHE